jgi:hypothetical protein
MRRERHDESLEAPVMRVWECQKSIDRAPKILGLKRITHHNLRHLLPTRCIESGVDIPTVSRWLGHKDGGAFLLAVIVFNYRPNAADRFDLCSLATPHANPADVERLRADYQPSRTRCPQGYSRPLLARRTPARTPARLRATTRHRALLRPFLDEYFTFVRRARSRMAEGSVYAPILPARVPGCKG